VIRSHVALYTSVWGGTASLSCLILLILYTSSQQRLLRRRLSIDEDNFDKNDRSAGSFLRCSLTEGINSMIQRHSRFMFLDRSCCRSSQGVNVLAVMWRLLHRLPGRVLYERFAWRIRQLFIPKSLWHYPDITQHNCPLPGVCLIYSHASLNDGDTFWEMRR
jgi:hypothetical protein